MSKRISKKKRLANKANARKSTGPRTADGKARAAKNAIKHGLLSNAVVVDAANESQEQFDQLFTDLQDDLQPAGPIQITLTERIATCYWRLRRAQRYESGCIERNLNQLFSTDLPDSGTPLDFLTDIANLPEEDDLRNLIRYESMIDRQLHRALHELRQQQKQQRKRNTISQSGCHAHATRNTKHSPSQITQELDTRTSASVGMSVTPTAPTSPQVQLPERFSTLDFGPEPARLGGTSEAPLRETNPSIAKNNPISPRANDLQADTNNVSNPNQTDQNPELTIPATDDDKNHAFNDWHQPISARKPKERIAI